MTIEGWLGRAIVLCGFWMVSGARIAAQENVPLLISETMRSDAPAIAPSRIDPNLTIVFWVGTDERGVHHDARRIDREMPGPVVTLPLPPSAPFDQKAVALSDGAVLLFWRDRAVEGGFGLFSARIGADLQVERGPVEVASDPIYQYDALSDGEDGAVVVWSGGPASEPTLTARRVDQGGRPLLATPLGVSGLNPALTYDRQGVGLFWTREGEVWTARLSGGDSPTMIGAPDVLTTEPFIDRGDALPSFSAGSDGSTVYLFWNIARRDGGSIVWMASGQLDDPFWEPPTPMLTRSGDRVLFARPLAQAADPLPVSVFGTGLEVQTFRDGERVSASPSIAATDLMRPPALAASIDGGLVLSWSEAGASRASLRVLRVS